MGPNKLERFDEDARLRQLLREWQAPETPPSLDRRVIGARPAWWRFLLAGHIKVPMPLAYCVIALIAAAVWQLTKAPSPCATANSTTIETPAQLRPADARPPVLVAEHCVKPDTCGS